MSAYSDKIQQDNPIYYFQFSSSGVSDTGSVTPTISVGGSNVFNSTGGVTNTPYISIAGDNSNAYGFSHSDNTDVFNDKIFSISGWYKVASSDFGNTNQKWLLHFGTTATGVYLQKTDKLYIGSSFANAQVDSSSITLSYDTWTHFAITHDETDFKLYIDGTLVSTVSSSGNINIDNSVKYWMQQTTGGTPRNGVRGNFDELAVFNTALSSTVISEQAGLGFPVNYSASVSTASSLFVDPVIQTGSTITADPATASALITDTQVSNFNYTTRMSTYIKDTLGVANYFKFDDEAITNYGTGGQTQWFKVGNYVLGTDNITIGPANEPYGRFDNVLTTLNVPRASEPLWTEDIENDDFTLGLWFNWNGFDTNGSGTFIKILNSNFDPLLELGLTEDGYLTGRYETTTENLTLTGNEDLTDGEWHLVALSYKASTSSLKLWHDDGVVATGELSGTHGAFERANLLQGFEGIPTNVAISTMFIDSTATIGETQLDEIYALGSQFITAHAIMPMPTTVFSTALYDYILGLTPVSFLKFDGAGNPTDFGDLLHTWNLNGTAGDIIPTQPAKNIYSYKFTDKETFYEATAEVDYGTAGDQITAFAFFKVDPSLMNDGGTGPYGSKNIIFSPSTSGTGGLVIGVGADNFFAYIANADYSEETIIESTAGTLTSGWHLMVVVKDGTSFTLYVDGKEVASDTLDASIEFTDGPGYGFIGGQEVYWFSQDNTPTEKYIDTAGAFANVLTAQQIFEMHQLASTADVFEASAMFPVPEGIAGSGPTITAEIMDSSALFVDPTQQDTVAPEILPMIAFIDTVTPNFEGTSTVNAAVDPMTGSAEPGNAQSSVGDFHAADHMDASVEMGDHRALIPGFWNASPMIANPAEMIEPGLASTQGGLVLAEVMTASAVMILPPAYKSLFDDNWYDLLYSQHSVRHGVRFANGGNGEAILKLFDDVTTDKASGSTIKNNLPTTITSDGIIVSTEEPNMNMVAEFTPTNNQPLLGIGFFDSYERKAVNFNNITTGYENSEFSNTAFSFELSIKTTKANQIIAFGKTRSFSATQQYTTSYGLSDGKLFLKSTAAIGPAPTSHYKETTPGDVLIGNKRIDDGEWHHIVIQNGWDDNRIQFWIDGELDKQKIGGLRLDGPSFLGFNSQTSTYASDFQTSVWSYDSHAFPRELEIDNHRYAYIKYEPVRAEPMIASATSGDHLAAGNRARALMLYWWPTDSFQNPPLNTKEFNTAGFPDVETWATELSTADFIKSGPQDYYGWDIFPVDITGYFVSDLVKQAAYGGQQNIKTGSKPFIGTGQRFNTNPEYLYNAEGSFKDPITDARRYIDLVNDIDLRNFDAIFFKNFPDDTKEKESYTTYEDVDTYFGSKEVELYDAFIKSLRAAVDIGLSLYVTNPQLAIDLGIVDRIEAVSDMDDLAGSDSDPYTPTLVPETAAILTTENAAKWADTYKNNRLRVVNTLEGFTTEPSFIRSDRAYYYNDDANNFGAANRPFTKFVYRPNGLQVGDEMIIANDPQNVLGFSNARTYLAVPFENVKAGTIITAFANTVKRGLDTIANPYANYATCIVVEPGDALKGTQCGGKIVVNFTENLNGAYDNGDVDLVSDYWINIAYNDEFITEAQKNTYLDAPYNIDRQLANNIITQSEYNKLAFWSSNGMNIITDATLIDDPTDSAPRDGLGTGARSSIVTKTRKSGTAYSAKVTTEAQWFSFAYAWLYPRMGIKVPSILTRGFWWLSNRESYDGTVERPLAATTSAVFVDPAVAGQKDAVLDAPSMIASGTIVQSQGTSAEEINLAPLPMQATALINNYVTRYLASPMTASATLRINNTVFTTAVDEVVVYVMHTDPILYIREDVIK
jgi:hypothetical protein